MEYRKNQIKIREDELMALKNELYDEETILHQRLGFPDAVKLDISKLTIAGHSFGE